MVLFICTNFLDAQFLLSHFLSRKIIFYTGFFISVIALYLEKKDFRCNCLVVKKETKLQHSKLPHLLTCLGHIRVKATHGYPKLHAHPNYDLLCPHFKHSINAGLFERQTKYIKDFLVFASLEAAFFINFKPCIVFCSNSYCITVSKYDSLIALLKVKLVSLPLFELLAQLRR